MTNSEMGNSIQMHIIFYGKHTPLVDSTIVSVQPGYLIGNPPHGLWGEFYGHNAQWLLRDITRFQKEGIKVIGYLSAGYEGKGSSSDLDLKWCTLNMNKKLITAMAYKDLVNGVFIDECSRFPDKVSKAYLKELSELAHDCGLIVWGNVGVDDFDEWFFNEGGFDMINSSEDWQGQTLTPIQKKWRYHISVTGFHSTYTITDAYNLISDALDKGLSCAYICNDEYLNLPTWIKELARLLKIS